MLIILKDVDYIDVTMRRQNIRIDGQTDGRMDGCMNESMRKCMQLRTGQSFALITKLKDTY